MVAVIQRFRGIQRLAVAMGLAYVTVRGPLVLVLVGMGARGLPLDFFEMLISSGFALWALSWMGPGLRRRLGWRYTLPFLLAPATFLLWLFTGARWAPAFGLATDAWVVLGIWRLFRAGGRRGQRA